MQVIIMPGKVTPYIRLAAENEGSAASVCCYKELNTDI